MLAQPTQEAVAVVEQSTLKADHVSKHGRAFTVVVFAIVGMLLVLTFIWMGARRINNFFVNRGDQAITAQDYQSARRDYTWAIRVDRHDGHAYLNRGYALQNLNNDERAVRDLSKYIELQPAQA